MKRLLKQGSTRVGLLACLMLGLLALACLSLPPFLKKAEAGCNPPPGEEIHPSVTLSGPANVCLRSVVTFPAIPDGDSPLLCGGDVTLKWDSWDGIVTAGDSPGHCRIESKAKVQFNVLSVSPTDRWVSVKATFPPPCEAYDTQLVTVVTAQALWYSNKCETTWTNLPNETGDYPPPFIYVGTNVGIRVTHQPLSGEAAPHTNHWPASCGDQCDSPKWGGDGNPPSTGGIWEWILTPEHPGAYEITAVCNDSAVIGRLTALKLDTLTVHEPDTAHAKLMADSTDEDPPRSESNTLFICQTQDSAVGPEASINFDLTWLPTGVDPTSFKWDIVTNSGGATWTTNNGNFGTATSATSTWEAPSNQVPREYDVRAWYDQCDNGAAATSCPHRLVYLTVVDLDTNTLSSVSNCLRSVVDTTRTTNTPTGTNAMLSLLQIGNRKSVLDEVKMTLDLTWLPSTVNSNWFLWKTEKRDDGASGWAEDDGSYAIRPYTNTWRDNADAAARTYDVWSWFDCNGNGIRDDEPQRFLKTEVVFFEDIEVTQDPLPQPGLLKLSPGARFTANLKVREPTRDREMEWKVTSIVHDDDANKLKVTPMSMTTTGNFVGVLSGGGGRFTLQAVDPKLPCVKESVVVNVGCEACSASRCSAPGSCMETTQAGFRYDLVESCLWLLTTNSPTPKDLLPPRHRTKVAEDLSYKWPPAELTSDKMDVALSNQVMQELSNPYVTASVSESPTNWSLTFNPAQGGVGHTYTFANTSGGGPNIEYTVTETRGSYTNIEWFARGIEGGSNFWRRTSGAGAKVETELSSFDGVYTNELSIVQDAAGTRSYVAARKRFAFPWGAELVEQTIDPDGAALRTTWTYYTNSADTLRYGRVMTVTEPDGSWTRYDYTQYGLHSVVVSGFKDTASNADPSEAKATYYTYDLGAALSPYSPRSVTETTLGVTNSKTLSAYSLNGQNERVETVERCLYGDDAFGSTNNLRTVTTFYSAALSNAAMGRVKSVVQTDGRQDSYIYERGTYVTNADPALCSFTPGVGTDLRTTVTHGTTNSPAGIAGKTTRNVTVSDSRDRTLLSETWVYTGSAYERVDWTVETRDIEGRVIRTDRSDGTSATATWGCCNKESEQDENGIQYENGYDALRRLDLRVKLGATTNDAPVYTAYTYDASGRQLGQVVSAGGLSQTTTNAYDLAGRLVWSRDAAGIETAYIHAGLTETAIRAGLTNVTVRYLDGQPKYTVENGVLKSFHDYGINADGTQWRQVYTGPTGTNSPAWQKTTTDLLGRTIRTERPGFGGTVLTNSSYYNTIGQLVRNSNTSQADTLSVYNELGQQTRSGLDINGDGGLTPASMDRIQDSTASYEQIDGAWFLVNSSAIYAGDNSSIPTTNSIQRTRLTGFDVASGQRSETVSLDLLGNTTTSRTYINRTAKTVTQVVTFPDSTNAATQVSINGLPSYSLSKTGVRTDYLYDALGRQAKVSGLRYAVYTHYNACGQVDWTEDSASNRTTFAYDSFGRRISVTDALSNTVYTAYDSEGRATNTWGATYPVAYGYDNFGRMASMRTYRTEGGAGDETKWLYDEATGLLTNKVYADTNGTAYTYTPDGKLASRTWARNVSTTYSYDSMGQLTNINYSDSTPDVSFTFDRLGRQTAITDGTGTRTFAYNATLQLAAETNALGAITRNYDSLGRSAGFTAESDYSVNYGYDPVGRFASVSNNVGAVPRTAFYSYLPGSDLLSGYDLTSGTNVFRTRKTFEANRVLIATVSNLWNGVAVSPFEYLNDELARRVRRVDNATVTNDFGYNLRSELANAAMGTNRYGYAYDPIGNRLTATNNAEALTYLANALNQYTNIADGVTNSPTYDADGNMLTCGPWVFSWDAENRLVAAANSSTVISNSYDYMSRRVSKSVNGSARQFLYDGWAMIRDSTASETNTYVYGLDLSGTLQGAGTIGGILAVCLNGTNAFCAFDANGNLTDLVGADGGAHYEYDPYGNTIRKTGPLADVNPFRFSTKYTDDETSLLYYGHRYYSPDLSRWVNRDPIGEDTHRVSLYCFVDNDPIDVGDSLGLDGFKYSLQTPPGRTIGDQVAGYEFYLWINLPATQSAWPADASQVWQLNEWTLDGNAVDGKNSVRISGHGFITDVENSTIATGGRRRSVGRLSDWLAYKYDGKGVVCFLSRKVVKKVGWNRQGVRLSSGTRGRDSGHPATDVPIMRAMRNSSSLTYSYSFENHKDCECKLTFVGPVQGDKEDKITEELIVPGIDSWKEPK